MRFALVFWLILFALGALIGERYGVPGFATSITDKGFERIEGLFGRVNEPIPEAPAEEPASEPTDEPSPAPDSTSEIAENSNLRMNDAGLQIIKDSEGLRLESYELNGQWYVGYGHSRTARAGMTITEAEADALLREDVRGAEDGVKAVVTVPLNENQFSAMVSLAYNLGIGGFKNTTVFERINEGDYAGAADGFLNHDRTRINGELVTVPHLTERREKERTLFLTPV